MPSLNHTFDFLSPSYMKFDWSFKRNLKRYIDYFSSTKEENQNEIVLPPFTANRFRDTFEKGVSITHYYQNNNLLVQRVD